MSKSTLREELEAQRALEKGYALSDLARAHGCLERKINAISEKLNELRGVLANIDAIADDADIDTDALKALSSQAWSAQGQIKLSEKADELIVDGAVTAKKIAAGSTTADKIAAGSITSDKIAAGSVSASKLVLRDFSRAA